MMLKFPEFPAKFWIRKCDECNNYQVARDPNTVKGESWRYLKCSKCKSEAMDFGQLNTEVDEEGEN